MASRNNGLSLVAKLNIALSEQAISEDLKKISDTLNGKNLPSFIAHLNIKGSASAMNKELQELGKKLKVDFGKIATGGSEQKMKQVGKKIAQSVFNVQELKKAGRDYIYNENDLQKQIDKLQARYDKRSISMANSVTVQAVTNEKNAVTGLVVEYQNLEKQLVKVNYQKVRFDNKKTGFAVTNSTYADSTIGKEYQQTLNYLNKIESQYRKIHNDTIGYSSPIKEGTKAFAEYNAKAEQTARSIMEIRNQSKVLSAEQKSAINYLIEDFRTSAKVIKESAKGANALNAKNLESSVKNANSELTTMLKVLYKNSEYSRNLGNEFHGIVGKITDLRSFLNGVVDNSGFTEYQVRLRSLKDEIRQFNADALKANNTEALKRSVSDLQGKITAFIRENNTLTESYKKNLTDIATKAQFTNSKFELRGLANQANALMNAKTQSDNLGRSILTLNNSLNVSEQKLLEMQNDTAGLDVEFQRVVDTLNGVRTRLGTVSNKNEFKDIRISAQEAKQEINDLYRIWQQRQITNQKLVANQTLDNISEKLQRQKNDLYGLDTEYNNYTQRIIQLQTALNNAVDRRQFNAVSADIRVLQSQLQGFYADIEGRRKTTLFNENTLTQLLKIDANAHSVASNIAKDSQLMQAYEVELNRVMTEIGNITQGTEVLSDQQEIDIRRLVENFRLYEAELQKVAAQGFKPTFDQNINQYDAQLNSMLAKLNSMSTQVTDGMSGAFNNVRATIRGLQNQLATVTDEKGLTNFRVNFQLATEAFNQFTSALNGDRSLETLDNKIRTLSSDMNKYLQTNLTLPDSYRASIENLMTQLQTTVSTPQFEQIKTQWHELINQINAEVVRINGVPLKEAIDLAVQGLNTLRQSMVAQKGDVGVLDEQYQRLLGELEKLKVEAGNIRSADQFIIWSNDAAILQQRVTQLKNSIKSTTEIDHLAVQSANLISKINLFIAQNSKMGEQAKQKLRELANQAQQAQSKMELTNINTQFQTFTNKLKEADKVGQSLFDRMKQNLSKFTAWFGMTTMVMRLITQIRQMIGYVKELDTAMVNLKKVTDETDQVYQRFFERAGKSAQALHANMANVITATADFAKLGYSIGESEQLAKASIIYQNVGEISDISEASKSIISTMKAFGVEAKDVMQIVDKFNKVGNEFSITSEDIGSALQRSASALAASNNTLEESIGLIVGANSVVLIVPLGYSNIVISSDSNR